MQVDTSQAIQEIADRFSRYDEKWTKEQFLTKLIAALEYIATTHYDIKDTRWYSIHPDKWQVHKLNDFTYRFELKGTILQKGTEIVTNETLFSFIITYSDIKSKPFNVIEIHRHSNLPLIDEELEKYLQGTHASILDIITILFSAFSRQDHRYQELRRNTEDDKEKDRGQQVAAPQPAEGTAHNELQPSELATLLGKEVETLAEQLKQRLSTEDGKTYLTYDSYKIDIFILMRMIEHHIQKDELPPLIGCDRILYDQHDKSWHRDINVFAWRKTIKFTFTLFEKSAFEKLARSLNLMVSLNGHMIAGSSIQIPRNVPAIQDKIKEGVMLVTKTCFRKIDMLIVH